MVISVIIPTHNRSEALDLTLEYLAKQDYSENWEAIVINNNSTDNTDEVVKNWQEKFPVVLHLVHEKTPGPAAARNAGAQKASGKFIIFIDNDILVGPDFLQKHYSQLIKAPKFWFVGQVTNLPEQENTVFGQYRKHLYPQLPTDTPVVEIDGITGQTTSMSKSDFDSLSGFDENFHVASGEDRELAIRAIQSGIKIFLDPSIIVQHNDWAGSSISDFCNRQRLYSQTEPFFWRKYGNSTPRIEMVKKNLPPNLQADGLKLFVWKYCKSIIGSNLGQSLSIKICQITERVFPNPAILWRLYRLTTAGAIYQGFQDGLKKFSGELQK